MCYKYFDIKVVLHGLGWTLRSSFNRKFASSWCWHSWKVLKKLGVQQNICISQKNMIWNSKITLCDL